MSSAKYNFDALLDRVTAMGKFQYITMAITYSYWAVIGLIYVSIVFLGATPPYRCNDLDPANDTKCDMEGIAVEKKSCYESNLTTNGNVSFDAKYCTNGYVYDCSTWEHTITIDWDLVCERRTLNSIATFCFFGGVFFASALGGILSDKYGRKTTGMFAILGTFVFNMALAFSPSFWWFCFFRFMIPLFSQMAILCGHTFYILRFFMLIFGGFHKPPRSLKPSILEVSSREWRTFIGVTSNTSFAIGVVILSGVAYILRHWRHLQIALACCLPPFAVAFYFLPESPRWLFAYQRNDEAKKSLRCIAKTNGAEQIKEEEWCKYEDKEVSVEDNHKVNLHELLKYPTLMKIFANMAFQWFVCSMVYYGLTLNAGSLSGDIFINTALTGVMDIAGCAVSHPAIKFIGCRKFNSLTLLVAGIALFMSISTISTVPGWVTFGTALAMVGKFAVSGTFATVYLYVPEIFPTDIRTTALGFSSASARIGSMLTPFALQLSETVPWATQVIFGTLSLTAAALCMLLPETHNKPMLTNVAEAEEIYSKRKARKSIEMVHSPLEEKKLLHA